MARTSTTRDNAPTGADAHPSGVERQHLPMGSFVAGTYRIEGLLGEGGGGVVYRAVHVELGRAFAVKVLRAGAEPDAAWRFVQEAKIASSLAHPNIVDVVHLGRDEAGRHFVVMELLAGEDLQGRLQRVEGTGLPFEEAQALFAATLDGVAAAHEAGVVHRDLKPANIFLAERRGSVEVKVLDFGMSRSRDAEVHVTRTGELVGTPLYMAPEQSKQAGVDARSDVYSLGVVAYEMLAGRVPFPAETLYACVLSHALQAPPPLEEAPGRPSSPGGPRGPPVPRQGPRGSLCRRARAAPCVERRLGVGGDTPRGGTGERRLGQGRACGAAALHTSRWRRRPGGRAGRGGRRRDGARMVARRVRLTAHRAPARGAPGERGHPQPPPGGHGGRCGGRSPTAAARRYPLAADDPLPFRRVPPWWAQTVPRSA